MKDKNVICFCMCTHPGYISMCLVVTGCVRCLLAPFAHGSLRFFIINIIPLEWESLAAL